MENSATQSSSSSTSNALARVIIKSRIALGAQKATQGEIDAQVDEWSSCLDRTLPADRLEEVYRAAMQTRQSSYPLAVTELNEAWRILRGREQKPEPPPCPGCEFAAEGGRSCRFHPETLQTEAGGVT